MASDRTSAGRIGLAEQITALIFQEGLAAGDPLPSESQLMEVLLASRNSIRESLRALQALGIVEIRHGHGTFVGSAPLDAVRTSLVFRARLASQSRLEILRDLTEIREILESHFICLTIENASPSDLTALEEAVERMGVVEERQEADKAFHELLYQPCGNSLMLEFVQLFWETYRDVQADLPPAVDDAKASARNHRAILNAVRAGDAAAARKAIRKHFDDVRARTSQSLRRPKRTAHP
jgi:DNA-binding FadR family transcriptional regulator